ncbi:polyubiquitin-like [Tachysurus fulvidraco]|uniref:polyubiquitin-like n=1 Tax=Tachysurus fulvidraco TaxID=1234273 RepID=UPI001FEFCCB8|nr:polyubiquitin-like [Tachysurus fulvidraco]XP_047674041.1 polyubiquitin-like [Tachysurus fulvidraco]XP_047674042.1 polyubiquitin-like [Tachysurus fulvidraco]
MELIIKVLSGETKTVQVNPGDTIGALKQKVAQIFNARPSRLRLSVTNGCVVQLDNDQETVSSYGLSSGATVMLLISMTPVPLQVFVKNEKGQMKTYDVTDDETVDQLMKKVRQKEGAPEDQQRLIYSGRQLESGRKLQDYGIVSGSTIHMTLRLRGG